VRLAANVDGSGEFIQQIDYEAHETGSSVGQRIAGDPRMQVYLPNLAHGCFPAPGNRRVSGSQIV